MKNSTVDIVITTFNSEKYITELLDSVKAQDFNDYACYVIDDNSSDNTAKIINDNYQWVHLIRKSKNSGPAGNRNIAASKGSAPFIIFLDGDVFIKDANWIQKAVRLMEADENIGQLAAMIVSGFDEDILLDCGIMQKDLFFGGIFHKQNKNNVLGKHLIPGEVLGACTAGTMLKREVFEKIGGFDVKYFYMSEDLDLSIRVRFAGYKVGYEPSLVIHHYESHAMGKTPKLKEYLYNRNSLFILLEHYPLGISIKKVFFFFTKSFFLSAVNLLIRLITLGKKKAWLGANFSIKALFALLYYSPLIIFKRHSVDSYRKIPRSALVDLNNELTDNTLLELPVRSMIYSITNKCNAKCKMCFQHKDLNKQAELLSLSEIRRIIENLPFLENIVLGGGEPFLRNDIVEICEILIKSRNPVITIPTNASLTDVVYEKTKKILGMGCKKLVISLSLDGNKEIHDSNRGVNGLYEKIFLCYGELAKLKEIYGNRLLIQINTCVSMDNIDQIDFLHNHIKENMPYAEWIFEPIRGFYDSNLVMPISISDWEKLYSRLQAMLNNPSKSPVSYENLINIYDYSIQTLKAKKQMIPCLGGNEFIYLDHEGNIFPCEILQERLNIRDFGYNANSLMGNSKWLEIQKKIKHNKCYCTHFCWLSYSMDRYGQTQSMPAKLKSIIKHYFLKS